MTSLDVTPRVPCASLLVRIMTPGGWVGDWVDVTLPIGAC